MFKYNNIFLIVLAIGLCVSLVFAENLIPVYAFSITFYDVGAGGANGIARIGNQIAVSQSGSNQVLFRSVANPNTNLGTITGLTSPQGLAPNSGGSRLYSFGSLSYLELDPINYALLRSVVHGCAIGEGNFFDSANNMMYCVTSTETVKAFSMNSMTNTFTSSTMNAGATPCVVSVDIAYESATDTLFASCTGPSRIAAIVGLTTSGTPDFAIAPSGTPNSIAWNTRGDNLLVCKSAGSVELFNYTAGFTLWQTFGSGVCAGTLYGDMQYDFTSDRFFYHTSNDVLEVRDGTTGDQLFSSVYSGGGEDQIFVYSNLLSYLANVAGAAGTDIAVFEMSGIELGSNGEEEPDDGGTGIDCTLPENEFILICRLGGDGSLVGAGNFIVGNVNGTTGLTPIICATGIVDCVANPDMKTNGVGYLLVTIALAIIIGILWVASRGDLNSIPTFIWFVATLAVVGAFTLMDLIDATFLVITTIIVVALAAAKVRGLFGGEFR